MYEHPGADLLGKIQDVEEMEWTDGYKVGQGEVEGSRMMTGVPLGSSGWMMGLLLGQTENASKQQVWGQITTSDLQCGV